MVRIVSKESSYFFKFGKSEQHWSVASLRIFTLSWSQRGWEIAHVSGENNGARKNSNNQIVIESNPEHAPEEGVFSTEVRHSTSPTAPWPKSATINLDRVLKSLLLLSVIDTGLY